MVSKVGALAYHNYLNIVECLNDWTDNYDQSTGTDVINLDFAKAFDMVPHKRLIHKLRAYGIRGKVLNWIKSFLSHRRQKVVLRLLYVNDIPSIVASTAKMFADDTKLYCPIQSREDCLKLQSDLNRLTVWSKNWLLKFNESKCVVLSNTYIFSKRLPPSGRTSSKGSRCHYI